MALETDPTLSPSQAEPSPAAPGSDASKEWMGEMRAGVRARLFAGAEPEPPGDPNRIGRYVVIKRIGAGGMGVVYAAYDDKLDRKVAVKLLRPGFGRVGKTARQRLLREAQAIARLSHRAVIQVYEVGTHREEVFLAMEYVEGSTLKQWQPSRDWRDILARYVDAGRGLCAAHAAGIVHRDFKADNVLVRASDHAVRVVDFGLARTDGQGVPTESPPDADEATEPISLTHTGVIMGTPAYMAPEQHLAHATDARTDQFSFCASLFEALYGYRAFAGERLDELRGNVLDGAVEAAPRYTAVPPNIHRALVRGLAVDPAHRFPTMEALLAELALPRPARPWRRVAVAVALSAATVGAAATWSSNNTPDALSREAIQLRAAFEDARTPRADQTLSALEHRSSVQRWNDLVLAFAAESTSATDTLSALALLSTDDTAWTEAARARASDALRAGPVFAMRATPSPAVSVVFAPNTEAFAARTKDGPLLRWESPHDDAPAVLPFDRTVIDAAFDGDGALRVVLEGGRLATIPAGSTTSSITRIHAGELTRVATDGRGTVAVGTDDGTVMVLRGAEPQPLHEHAATISALAFHPTTATLASGDRTGHVSLWFLDRDTHRNVSVDRAIEELVWVSGGAFVVAQTPGGPVSWEGTRGTRGTYELPPEVQSIRHAAERPVLALHGPRGVVVRREGWAGDLPLDGGHEATDIAVRHDGAWTAAATPRGVTLWRTGPDERGLEPSGARVSPPLASTILDLHSHDARVFALTAGGGVSMLTPEGTVELAQLGQETRTLRLSPDGAWLASQSAEGHLQRLRVDEPDQAHVLGTLDEPGRGLFTWSPSGRALAKLSCPSVQPECTVSIHATDSSAAVVLGESTLDAQALRLDPGGQRVAALLGDRVALWSRERVRRYASPDAWPQAIDFDARGGLRIASWSAGDGPYQLQVRRVDTNGDSHVLLDEPGLPLLVASHTRDAIVLQTPEGTALLWRLSEDHFVPLPKGALELPPPLDVRVSPGGTHVWVASAGARTFTLHDLQSGQSRVLPRPTGPYAWTTRGAWVDVVEQRRIRTWDAAIPQHAEEFHPWLRTRTELELPVSALRRTMSKPDERL